MRVLGLHLVLLLLGACATAEESGPLDEPGLDDFYDQGGATDDRSGQGGLKLDGTRPTLSVMTQNIQGHGAASRLEELAASIAASDPDLVGLQEVYWGGLPSWNQAADVVKLLKSRYQKSYVYAYQAQQSWLLTGIGVAVLSKHPLEGTSSVALPKVEKENRVALRAAVKTPAGTVDFFVTHLTNDHTDGDSKILQQATALTSWVASFSGRPKIVVGDFNAAPSSVVYAHLASQLVDTWAVLHGISGGATLPASAPEVRFDYVFVDRASLAQPLASTVRGSAAVSDHLAVVSTIEL